MSENQGKFATEACTFECTRARAHAHSHISTFQRHGKHNNNTTTNRKKSRTELQDENKNAHRQSFAFYKELCCVHRRDILSVQVVAWTGFSHVCATHTCVCNGNVNARTWGRQTKQSCAARLCICCFILLHYVRMCVCVSVCSGV